MAVTGMTVVFVWMAPLCLPRPRLPLMKSGQCLVVSTSGTQIRPLAERGGTGDA